MMSSSNMDLSVVVRSYIDRMLKEVQGMKVLLLDDETTRIVSTVYSQSEILEQEVFLVQRLGTDKLDQLFHLKAVCFLRPTRENVNRVKAELRNPRYGGYHLFFSNRVEDMRLQELAEADLKEQVAQVQEFFGDFIVNDPHHFTVPLPRPHVVLQPFNWDYTHSPDALDRMTQGLASVVLSLRRRFAIRFQKGSEICQRLAESLDHLTNTEERALFDFGARGGETPPTILLLDRKEDPVTPLLSQWTYQAMVHELLGIKNNLVDLSKIPGVKKDFAEVVLAARQDDFYRRNMYANYGDLGNAVKELLDRYQSQTNSAKNIKSIQDMQNFVENFGEFSAAQRDAGKHVTLMTEMSRVIDARMLMQVSSLEQQLACSGSNQMGHYQDVQEMIKNSQLNPEDRVRLVALYAIRYAREGGAQIAALRERMSDYYVDPAALAPLGPLIDHAAVRTADLFSDRTLGARFTKAAKQGLKGVENVYTQHTPLLLASLEALARGRLRPDEFPQVGAAGGQQGTQPSRTKLVVVFVVGGTTYEESKAVADLNAAGERGEGWSAGMRVLLGGTGVQNSKSFMEDLAEVAREAAKHGGR